MFQSLPRTILTLVGIAAMLFYLVPNNAQAKLNPVFDELLLYNSPQTLPTVEVYALGNEWVDLSTKSLNVSTSYYVSLKKGKIRTINGYLDLFGVPVQTRKPDGGKRRWGTFEFTVSNMGSVQNLAVQACNALKKTGANTDREHFAYISLPSTLKVHATRAGNRAEKSVRGDVQVKVVCKQAPKLVTTEPLSVEYDNSVGTCPKRATVTVEFASNRGDRIDFELRHTNVDVEISEHSVQPIFFVSQYRASKKIDVLIDSRTQSIEVRLKNAPKGVVWRPRRPISCPPFKVTSSWLKYKVANAIKCPKNVKETATFRATGPGSASFRIKTQSGAVVHSGVATFKRKGTEYVAKVKRPKLMMGVFESDMMAEITTQPDANSGWVRLKVECIEALSGTLDLRSFKARACRGEAALSIRTNIPGKIPYHLECTGGRSWKRRVEAQRTGPNTYIGVDVLPFNLKRNEHVVCALKTREPLAVKILAGRRQDFSCFKATVDQPSSTFVSDPKPPSSPPRRCKERWKQVCKNVPQRVCRNVVGSKCVRVPKVTCRRVGKKTCRPVTRRVCRRVGSTNRQICRTVTRRQCFRTVARECKRTWTSSCRRTVERKCHVSIRRQCERKRELICKR